MSIVVKCGSCGKTIKAAEKFAGKRVKCPGCQAVLAIPAAASAAPTSPKAAAPASQGVAVGLVADGFPIQQQAPTAQPAAGSLADLFDDDVPIRKEPQQAQPAVQAPATCPGCGAPVQTGAVLCVNCGYDFRVQAKRTQQIGQTAAGGKKRRRKSKGGELLGGHSEQVMRLLRGCLFSFIGACVGAFIWYIVARFTFSEWAIISWGLGGMAGMGMAVGYGHEEMLGGICAAVIAFLGIIIAKLAIFFWILGPFLIALGGMGGDDLPEEEYADEEVVAGQEFPRDVEETESSDAESAVQDVAEGQPADDMEADEEYADEEYADEGSSEPIGAGNVAVLGAHLFFMTMFGIYDILFVILACATAFKLGSSGGPGGF